MQAALRSTQTATLQRSMRSQLRPDVWREYVSAAGKVSAVAWQGPWRPDMRQILSNYFENYRHSFPSASEFSRWSKAAGDSTNLNSSESGGHMRSFMGRAYIPGIASGGVSAETIQ